MMRMEARRCGLARASPWLLVMGGWLSSASGHAQDAARVIRIGDTPRCASCSIRLELLELRDHEDDPLLVSDLSSMVTLPDGRVLATQFAAQVGVPIIVGQDGTLQANAFRRGSGPGEYLVAARVLPWRSDSVLVLDPAQGRVSVLAPDGRFHRSVTGSRLVRSREAVTLRGGGVMAVMETGGGARGRAQLLVFDGMWQPGGELTLTGAADATRDRWSAHRRLAPAREGGAWIARVDEYELERRAASGALEFRLTREAPWFEPPRDSRTGDPEPPPRPLVLGLWEDAQGLLWVASLVADRRWRAALGAPNRTARGRGWSVSVERADRYVDTVIEALDVARGRVVARLRLDAAASAVSPEGRLALSQTSEDGVTTVRLARPHLTGYPVR